MPVHRRPHRSSKRVLHRPRPPSSSPKAAPKAPGAPGPGPHAGLDPRPDYKSEDPFEWCQWTWRAAAAPVESRTDRGRAPRHGHGLLRVPLLERRRGRGRVAGPAGAARRGRRRVAHEEGPQGADEAAALLRAQGGRPRVLRGRGPRDPEGHDPALAADRRELRRQGSGRGPGQDPGQARGGGRRARPLRVERRGGRGLGRRPRAAPGGLPPRRRARGLPPQARRLEPGRENGRFKFAST